MVTHFIPRSTLRSAASLGLLALAMLAGSACAGNPPEIPVRTTTPSGSWTAPSAAEAANRDRALVRIVAAIPGSSRLDLFVERQKLASGLEYKTIVPYQEVPSGRPALRLRPAGLDTADPLADETQQLRAGRHYTVVIMPGEEGGPAAAIRVFDDPMDVPENGRASLRIIHAAADAGRVDVHAQGRQDPLAGGLDFQRASDFTEIEPPARVELRPEQRTETMMRFPDLRLAGGSMFTVVVIGRTRIEPPLETLVIEDRLTR